MIESALEEPLSQDDVDEVAWTFRGHLESVTGHPNVWTSFNVRRGSFIFNVTGQWREGRVAALAVCFSPSAAEGCIG
jgi:hypothetical protein